MCYIIILNFKTLFEILSKILSSLQFFSQKKSAQKKIIFSIFFCFTSFFFHHFPFIYLLISFCISHLFLLSSFFILSLCLYLSVSLSLCSLSRACFIVFLLILHRRFCVFSFCFNSFFLSLFCSWSHSSFVPYSLLFFSSSPVVIFFFEWNYVFLFSLLPSLLRCFISCFFFTPGVVLFPCLFHVVLFVRASWHHFSWFSFINLLFWVSKKMAFCFEKNTKIH